MGVEKNRKLAKFLQGENHIISKVPYGLGYYFLLICVLWVVMFIIVTTVSISRLSENGKVVVTECLESDYDNGSYHCSEYSDVVQKLIMDDVWDNFIFTGKLVLAIFLIRLAFIPILLAKEGYDDAYRENFNYCSPWIKRIMEILHLRDKSE